MADLCMQPWWQALGVVLFLAAIGSAIYCWIDAKKEYGEQW